jgi:DNA polymerase-3 subunit epsilon
MVAHNARFDSGFLAAEFKRAGVEQPPVPTICTMELAGRYSGGGSRRLSACCEDAGVSVEGLAHVALNDARATARLLGAYIAAVRKAGPLTLDALGCRPTEFPPAWCAVQPSGRRVERSSAERRAPAAPYLARLVERLPPTPFKDPDAAAYLDLLDRCLADRVVTNEEADALYATADEWGLTRAKVFEAHHSYLDSLVRVALADGIVTDEERRDLESVCSLLGLHRSAVDAALARTGAQCEPASTPIAAPMLVPSIAPPRAASGSLAGLCVCFTGETTEELEGQRITRDVAEHLATRAGMFVRGSVTKKLDLLVLADGDSMSGKAKKARQYGTRMMTMPDFLAAIGMH